MLKFISYDIVGQEVPDEVALAINITNCPIHCQGCHSPWLWEDNGFILDGKAIDKLMKIYGKDITCVCFMGGDSEPLNVNALAKYVKDKYPKIKTALYSGRMILYPCIELKNWDFIKIGPYIEERGGLSSKTTNQRFFRVDGEKLIDETYKFWKK